MTFKTLSRRHFLGLSVLGSGLASGCTSGAPRPDPKDPRLSFDALSYRNLTLKVDGRELVLRAYEALPYVARPVAPDHQLLNLYIPEAYFQGRSVGRYDARSAPIFLPNEVGGYMPAKPGTPEGRMGAPPAPGETAPPGAIAVALSRGLVVASPGARGRSLRAEDGTWTGKAPAAIVDMKAAVRWLRHHAARMPGNTDRIIANGTSAGGALSALLGASGNHPDFESELRAVGAAEGRDDIFAVSAYCPITNLEHADAAYEWQFQGVLDYRAIEIAMLDFKVQRTERAGTLRPEQVALSRALAAGFPAYVNGLGLRGPEGRTLQLDAEGSGSLREHIEALLVASAQQALQAGQDLSAVPWVIRSSSQVQGIHWHAYVRAIGRQKTPPAFDGVSLESGENQLFGDARTDKRHFTDFSMRHSAVADAGRADARTVRMMNAMHYARDVQATRSTHWRIRHGTRDRDTSLAVPVLLAAALRAGGVHAVDLALPWDRPHSGDYDLHELFDWVDRQVDGR